MKKKIILLSGIVFLTFSCKKENTTPTNEESGSTKIALKGEYAATIKDVDGNSYKTVKLGGQTWMAENLKTTRFSDSTEIQIIKDDASSLSYHNSGCSEYLHDASIGKKYGKLYDWYTIDRVKNGNKNICPSGWHLPKIEEWKELVEYLGGHEVAGGYLKQAGTENWLSPNKDANNASLFNALPGGESILVNSDKALFEKLGSTGTWWSYNFDEEDYDVSALVLILSAENSNVSYRNAYKLEGLSVRCLKD